MSSSVDEVETCAWADAARGEERQETERESAEDACSSHRDCHRVGRPVIVRRVLGRRQRRVHRGDPRMRGSLVGSMLFAAIAALGPAHPTAPPATRVVMLGTGTPNADPERSGPAVAVVVGDAAYLIDAGPGIVRRAAQAARDDSIHALEPPRLRRVFITHLHSDHTVGLPDLILSPWVLGRTDPLDVFGPRGTKRMVDLLEQAYSEDVQIRLHGGEPSNKTGYAANAHDVGGWNRLSRQQRDGHGVQRRSTGSGIRRSAIGSPRAIESSSSPATRRPATPWSPPATGATCSSTRCTRPSDSGLVRPNGASITRPTTRPPSSWRTSRRRARPKLLVLYHQLYWGDDDAALLRQVRAKYRGKVVSAKDLGVY